jgi:hypothetical protein
VDVGFLSGSEVWRAGFIARIWWSLYPLFLNTVVRNHLLSTLHPAFEDGTDRGFRNVGKSQSDAGEIPKRTHTIFKTRRKFEIKNTIHISAFVGFNI